MEPENKDVYLDMLTDSGTNAMSDNQLGAMMIADDSYAGSETFYRLVRAAQKFFGKEYFLPASCQRIYKAYFFRSEKERNF